MIRNIVGMGLSAMLCGCGSGGAAGADILVAHPLGDGPLSWQSCPALPPVPGEPAGECSLNRVPRFWEQADGGTLDVLVRRFRPKGARRGTVWMLAGGPGGTGTVFDTPAWRSLTVDRGFAMMVPMPRGSGLSTALECPAQEAPDSELGAYVSEAEFGPCAAALAEDWGDGLRAFTSIETARDVLHLMTREKRPGERTFVWGGSYGSFWAQRLLEAAPDSVDGVILEGLVPTDADFLRLSANVDEAAQQLLAQCAAVPECDVHFQGGASAAAGRVIADESGCQARLGWDINTRQRLLAAPLLADTQLRPLLAPLVARLQRCSASDRSELHSAIARFPDLSQPPAPRRSLRGTLLDPLVQNLRLASLVIHSDFIRDLEPRSELERFEDSLLASNRQSLRFLDEHEVWPEGLTGHRRSQAPQTSVPMLLFAGALDAQTPMSWSRRVARDFRAPHQSLVVVPTAGHMTYNFARTVDGQNCTVDLWQRFMDEPRADPDLSCLERLEPIDWAGNKEATRQLSSRYLGTDLVWGGG